MGSCRKLPKAAEFISNGTYPGYVLFIVGKTYSEVIRELRRCGDKVEAGRWEMCLEGAEAKFEKGYHAMSREIESNKTGQRRKYYFIIIDRFDFSDFDYCKLTNECLHICQFFLPDILDRDKEHEAEAYFHTSLMERCLKVMRNSCERR